MQNTGIQRGANVGLLRAGLVVVVAFGLVALLVVGLALAVPGATKPATAAAGNAPSILDTRAESLAALRAINGTNAAVDTNSQRVLTNSSGGAAATAEPQSSAGASSAASIKAARIEAARKTASQFAGDKHPAGKAQPATGPTPPTEPAQTATPHTR